jgi:acyl carrier protein
MSDVYQKVLEIFRAKLDYGDDMEIRPEATFEELDIDSLDLLEVVMAIELEYGIEIPDDVLKDMNNVENAVKYVENLVNEGK